MKHTAFPSTTVCESCKERPGFPEVAQDGQVSYECAQCRTFHLQGDVAEAQLSEAVAPILGVWASQWTRAGLPMRELVARIEYLTGTWMAPALAHKQLHRTLRGLAAQHRHAAQEGEAPPARVQVTLTSLRRIEQMAHESTTPYRPDFSDAQGNQIMVWPGLDAVVMMLPDGARAVTYPDRPAQSFLCPARLWPAVANELKYLPNEEPM